VKLAVDAVEDVCSLPLSWKTVNSGGSRKRPVLRPSISMKLPQFFAAVAEVDGAGGGAEGAVGGGDEPVGVVTPWPERVVTSMTRLVLPPYSAGGAPEMTSSDWTELMGKLVGEDLALLVGDGLAVDGEGVGGVVAEAVEEAVGVGGDAGRGRG
jgi:hypothetical protein